MNRSGRPLFRSRKSIAQFDNLPLAMEVLLNAQGTHLVAEHLFKTFNLAIRCTDR